MISPEAHSWIDAPPALGEQVESRFFEVPGLYVGPSDSIVSQGWVQYPKRIVIPDDFTSAPDWIGRGRQDFEPGDNLLSLAVARNLAYDLAEWSRANTFDSFRDSVLG